MKTQKSALLGLALGLAAFGAGCKDTTTLEIPPTPPPPIVVTVTPQSLTLEVGQSAALAASVTGGAATDAKTVTWSTSNASVASVDGTGKVTAVAKGVATVTATSTADANAKGAASVTVTAPPPPAIPSVSIKSITTANTATPVNLNNVAGQIDITLNLDVPTGAQISSLQTFIVGSAGEKKVCEQTFSGGAEVGAIDEVNSASEIICSVNTAGFDEQLQDASLWGSKSKGTIWFANGPGYKVKVVIVGPGGTTTAQITSAEMIFNNASFIVAQKTSPTHCETGAVHGSGANFWCEGDIVAAFLPVLFGTGTINSVTLTASNGATKTDTDGSNGWSATLQKASTPGASSIGGVEGAITLAVTSTTASGQVGPALAPWPLGTGNLPPTAFLIDNVAPVITLFDLTPATLGCAPATACYISGNTATPAFAFAARSGFFTHTDGGVGSPTATFQAGVAGSLVDVTTASTLAESVTPNYIASAKTCDKLLNCRTQYASPAGVGQNSATGAQLFGVDSTDPTASVDNTTPDKSTNVGINSAYTISFSDAGVGPSGFAANPVSVQLKKTLPAGSTCYVPNTPFTMTSVACLTNSGAVNWQADDGIVDLDLTVPGTGEGYWQLSAFVRDQAGNFSKPNLERITLHDGTAPVLGGIAHPSSMAGGASFSITMDATDNVDLGKYVPWFWYGGTQIEGPWSSVGAYGVADGLVGQATVAYNVNSFMRAVENTNASGRVVAGPLSVGTVSFKVWDVAGNNATQTWGISPAVLSPVGGVMPSLTTIAPTIFAPANAAHGNFVMQAPSSATACSGTSSACGSSPPLSTVLSVTMTGPNATFANPFSRVEFYYLDPVSGRLVLIGSGSASASDNSVTSTRTWTYSLTWQVSGVKMEDGNLLAGAISVFAIGVHSSGSAVVTVGTPQAVTVTTT